MGLRSISKYLALIRVGMDLTQKGTAWLEQAKDEDGPGGEEITHDEYLELIPIIEEAVIDGLGLAVKVRIDPAD